MDRILILGASGLVGANLALALKEDHCVYGTYDSHKPNLAQVPVFKLDVQNEEALLDVLTCLKPSVVFYCAAIRDERACTENALSALTVNAEAAADVALCLRPLGGRLVYFSSSKVFSGQKGNYTEEDIPDPRSSYGGSKYRGEELLSEFENAFVLRIGTLFGFGPTPGTALLPRLLQQLWSGGETSFIADEYRDFQSVRDVVESARRFIHCEPEKAGLYNCPAGSRSSYYDFARALARTLGIPHENLHAIPGESLQAPFNTPDLRGQDTTLNGEKYRRTFGPVGEGLGPSLEALKTQLYTGNI